MSEDQKAAPPTAQPAAPDPVPSGSPSAGVALKRLTPKQQAVYDLARPAEGKGKTRSEIAALLGISKGVVSKTMQAAYKKLGMKPSVDGNTKRLEVRDPERVAATIDALTDPLQKVSEAMRAANMPDRVRESLLHRLRTKYFGVMTEVRNLKKMELDEMLGKKIHLMLSYIDDKVAGEASARDLAMGVAQLIEKQQLIRGEPTAIISDAERAEIHVLAPALLAEVQRRGLTVEGTVTERVIGPA